ncbi:hypothetical protein [Enterobacter sp. 03-F-08-SI-ECC]|uniref:hypothetical protein n=1 Tax=Enterobacter sp. 03-F-08-SI-ECC TaxID=3397237 RepID=UPI0039E09D7A
MENNDEIDVEYDDEMLAEKHNPRSIQAMMGWLYDKAVSGIAGIESAETLAERYLADAKGDVTKAAHAMIRWESVKAGSTGFLSGVGGVVAMPVTLPLNITSVLFLQTRLVAAIACLGKRNLADERIRALAGLCLCGNAAKALLQEVALQAMEDWTRPFTQRIVEKTLVLMAARAGMRTGGQFIRLVPLVGGVVSGAVDVTTTSMIGRIACTTFLPPYRGQRKS